jgi:hypothetical protein
MVAITPLRVMIPLAFVFVAYLVGTAVAWIADHRGQLRNGGRGAAPSSFPLSATPSDRTIGQRANRIR